MMAEPKLRHVAARAATDAARVPDRVFTHDLVLDIEIGVHHYEKGATQRVRFSVDVDLTPAAHALDDDIGRTFDYDTIISGIKAIVARGHINLVETLAEDVRSEEHTSELQSLRHLVCRLLLEKKKKKITQ